MPKLLLVVICMALMDGRMFGWRLSEARKDGARHSMDEEEDIRPLHCVVHPILRVRLPPPAETGAHSTVPEPVPSQEAGSDGQQQALGPEGTAAPLRRDADRQTRVRPPSPPPLVPAFAPMVCAFLQVGQQRSKRMYRAGMYLCIALLVLSQRVCSCLIQQGS